MSHEAISSVRQAAPPTAQLQAGIAAYERGEFLVALRAWLEASEQGNAVANYRVGQLYDRGEGVEGSFPDAVAWYKRAAAGGHVGSMYRLGVIYRYGAGGRAAAAADSGGSAIEQMMFPNGTHVGRDSKTAFQWLASAAEAGQGEAQVLLGDMLSTGEGCARDLYSAARWYTAAARQNLAAAQFALGEVCFHGRGIPEKLDMAVHWYRLAAEQHHVRATVALGLLHLCGKGVEEDHVEAARLFAAAAAANDAIALYHIGILHLKGDGVASDSDRAETELRNSARLGYLPAKVALGEFYARGGNGEPDLRESARWYEEAAEQGDLHSQFLTGRFYAVGDGVVPSDREAAKWFLRAAESGHSAAALSIATCYGSGSGVEKDVNRAIEWFEVAAEAGNRAAQIQLGRLYANGASGIERDRFRSAYWFQQAMTSGEPEAKLAYALFLLESETSESSRSQALELLTEAASAGHGPACLQLGHVLAGRMGGPAHLSRAVEWYARGAQAGLVDAMMAAAQLHLDTRSGVTDAKRAAGYLEQAADTGHAPAQLQLGVMYCIGNGVVANLERGFACYEAAARQNHPVAQYNLALMYAKGQGVKPDPQTAITWFERAAGQGLAVAQLAMGDALCAGVGTGKNVASAASWYRKAAEQGNDVARQRLSAMPDAASVKQGEGSAAVSENVGTALSQLQRGLGEAVSIRAVKGEDSESQDSERQGSERQGSERQDSRSSVDASREQTGAPVPALTHQMPVRETKAVRSQHSRETKTALRKEPVLPVSPGAVPSGSGDAAQSVVAAASRGAVQQAGKRPQVPKGSDVDWGRLAVPARRRDAQQPREAGQDGKVEAPKAQARPDRAESPAAVSGQRAVPPGLRDRQRSPDERQGSRIGESRVAGPKEQGQPDRAGSAVSGQHNAAELRDVGEDSRVEGPKAPDKPPQPETTGAVRGWGAVLPGLGDAAKSPELGHDRKLDGPRVEGGPHRAESPGAALGRRDAEQPREAGQDGKVAAPKAQGQPDRAESPAAVSGRAAVPPGLRDRLRSPEVRQGSRIGNSKVAGPKAQAQPDRAGSSAAVSGQNKAAESRDVGEDSRVEGPNEEAGPHRAESPGAASGQRDAAKAFETGVDSKAAGAKAQEGAALLKSSGGVWGRRPVPPGVRNAAQPVAAGSGRRGEGQKNRQLGGSDAKTAIRVSQGLSRMLDRLGEEKCGRDSRSGPQPAECLPGLSAQPPAPSLRSDPGTGQMARKDIRPATARAAELPPISRHLAENGVPVAKQAEQTGFGAALRAGNRAPPRRGEPVETEGTSERDRPTAPAPQVVAEDARKAPQDPLLRDPEVALRTGSEHQADAKACSPGLEGSHPVQPEVVRPGSSESEEGRGQGRPADLSLNPSPPQWSEPLLARVDQKQATDTGLEQDSSQRKASGDDRPVATGGLGEAVGRYVKAYSARKALRKVPPAEGAGKQPSRASRQDPQPPRDNVSIIRPPHPGEALDEPGLAASEDPSTAKAGAQRARLLRDALEDALREATAGHAANSTPIEHDEGSGVDSSPALPDPASGKQKPQPVQSDKGAETKRSGAPRPDPAVAGPERPMESGGQTRWEQREAGARHPTSNNRGAGRLSADKPAEATPTRRLRSLGLAFGRPLDVALQHRPGGDRASGTSQASQWRPAWTPGAAGRPQRSGPAGEQTELQWLRSVLDRTQDVRPRKVRPPERRVGDERAEIPLAPKHHAGAQKLPLNAVELEQEEDVVAIRRFFQRERPAEPEARPRKPEAGSRGRAAPASNEIRPEPGKRPRAEGGRLRQARTARLRTDQPLDVALVSRREQGGTGFAPRTTRGKDPVGDLAFRADRFVLRWKELATRRRDLLHSKNVTARGQIEQDMRSLAQDLERDPQLKAMLRSRAPELGLNPFEGES